MNAGKNSFYDSSENAAKSHPRFKVRAWLSRALLVFFSLVVTSLAVEGLLRLFLPQKLSGVLFESDSNLGYRNRRQLNSWQEIEKERISIHTNRLGFRQSGQVSGKLSGETTSGFPSPSEFRVLCLGDSFAFGWGVREEHSFIRILENDLRSRFPNTIVTLFNAGTPGWGTTHFLAYLESEGWALRPNFVFIFMGPNDIDDDIQYGLHELDTSGKLVRASRSRRGSYWFRLVNSLYGYAWLAERSHFLQFLRVQVATAFARLRMGALPQSAPPVSRRDIDSTGELAVKWNGATFNLSDALFTKINDQAREQNVSLAIIPVGHPTPLTSQFLKTRKEWFLARKIHFINAWESFSRQHLKHTIVFQHDDHLNAFGHQEWATWLSDPIARLLGNPGVMNHARPRNTALPGHPQ